MQVSEQRYRRQREQQVQRSWGKDLPGVFDKEQGGQCGQSREQGMV